jgi:AcrR family transcriptional regulator
MKSSARKPVRPAGARSGRTRVPPPGARHRAQPRWRRRKEERPAEILAAALEQFVEHGYAGSKLEDVARRAGVTKGTMYRYYDSKDALFKAVVRETVVPHIAAFEREVSTFEGSARELVIRFARGWMERVYRSPISGLAKLIISEAGNFPELVRFYREEVIDRMGSALERVLERGIERGEFRRVDTKSAARVLRAPLILATIWKHSFMKCEVGVVDQDRLIDTYLDMMLYGLLARPAMEGADV